MSDESARKLIETLNKNAKSNYDIVFSIGSAETNRRVFYLHQLSGKKEWVSVETVTALLVELFRENAIRIEQIKNEKDTKIEALQLAILSIYKPEIAKLKRELDEKVMVSRKQLEDIAKASLDVWEELDGSDAENYILIMASHVANSLKELLEK